MKTVFQLLSFTTMMLRFRRFLERRSPVQIVELSLAMVAILGLIDQFVEDEISVSVFYLFPIALATWYAPRPVGSLFCFLSTAVWLGVDINSHAYVAYGLPIWNSLVRLVFFLVVTRHLGLLKAALRREQALSRTDSLTQVLNPRGFDEAAERLLQLAHRHQQPVTLAYIDLDNFKHVNDTLGHSVGDRVLQEVGAMLLANVRSTDVVGRLGGDEFAVFMPVTALEGARAAFTKIRTELLRASAGKNYPIGFSIGVAVFPAAPASLDDAIRIADDLMYQVKTSGKNNLLCVEQPATPAAAANPA